MRAFFLILAIVILSSNLYSQNLDTVWTKIYDFTECDSDDFYLIDGIFTTDSCIVLGGVYFWNCDSGNVNIQLIKIDRDGDSLWTKTLGMESNYFNLGGMLETYDSCIIVVGVGSNSLVHTFSILKLDLSGNLIWEKSYSLLDKFSGLRGLIETDDDGFMIVGANRGNNFIIRLNAEGDSLWSTDIMTSDHYDYVFNMVEADDGGAILSRMYILQDPRTDSLCATKIDSLGNEIWKICYTYSGSWDDASDHELNKLSDGSYIICLTHFPEDKINLYRFSEYGQKLDTVSFQSGFRLWMYDLYIDEQDFIFLTGFHFRDGPFVTKVNSSLEEIYSELAPHNIPIYGVYIYKDCEDYIYIACCETSGDIALIKLKEQVVTSVTNQEIIVPSKSRLSQNYPNPFNPSTRIDYMVESRALVTIDICNSLGQVVCNLLNDEKPAGNHSITWNGLDSNGKQAATGVYFYRVSIGDYIESKKMMLLK